MNEKARKSALDRLEKIMAEEGDTVLTDLLGEIGYGDVVEAWEKLPKWYA